MPNPPQPWYTPGPPQEPVPGNPYASQGYGPQPGPPPPRRRSHRGPVIAAVVAFVLVAAGGAGHVLLDRGDDGPAAPVAGESPGAVASPSPPGSPAPGASRAGLPTTREINAARKPGDAAAWIVDDPTDLPGGNNKVHDLWIVGDLAVQALHRKVTAYRLSDGAEVWSVALPSTVCETPADPTPDGKVVLLHRRSAAAERMNPCDQLQMIDLKTGEKGWHKELAATDPDDSRLLVYSAISGGAFAIAHDMRAAAYRVDDGSKLYDIPWEEPKCFPDGVAGGARLLVISDCAVSADRRENFSQLREIDPRTGKVLWRHRTPAGWKSGRVISVDPVVFTTVHAERTATDWRVFVLGPGGKLRTTFDAREKGFEHCAGDGAGSDAQPCRGTAVGHGHLVLGGTDRIGTYDLSTGKFLWGVKSDEPRRLHPLRAEAGKAMLVYETASPSRPGRVYRMGPRGAGTEKEVLRHPAASAEPEYKTFGGRLAYADGRLVMTSAGVDGDDDRREARMLSFAPGPS
ncbi:PQQ-binding-like beta-propeller repeat protein [Streptomyces pratensis]|uniref:outer membrane protein assembly factor BamB family protein n=1 Tax=Streptomyces pratensis TaxID=1169025 RepID=UPI0030183465